LFDAEEKEWRDRRRERSGRKYPSERRRRKYEDGEEGLDGRGKGEKFHLKGREKLVRECIKGLVRLFRSVWCSGVVTGGIEVEVSGIISFGKRYGFLYCNRGREKEIVGRK